MCIIKIRKAIVFFNAKNKIFMAIFGGSKKQDINVYSFIEK